MPLSRSSDEDDYAAVFEGVFSPVLKEFRPGLIIVSAGFDSHVDDPIGGMRLQSDSFRRFGAWVASLARELDAPPPALVLEGGYDLSALTACVAATIKGVSEESDVGWNSLPGIAPVEDARRAQAPFWEALR